MNAFVDPATESEWRTAVDAAKLFLLIDSARQYGLVRYEFEVDAERCEDIIQRGAALGYTPRDAEILVREAFGAH